MSEEISSLTLDVAAPTKMNYFRNAISKLFDAASSTVAARRVALE